MENDVTAFPQFDVVSGAASDHLYFNTNNSSNNKKTTAKPSSDHHHIGNLTPGAHKRVMHDWKLLQKHLPDTIFVRVYEQRIDLLRAVIVGATGTPYHDALFFFDIAFPSDYPNRPPNVSFRSFGLRVNPNLYANGRVCLSLLNTWQGMESERWDPKTSTLLQVLLSIQALVLNDKPFFNEPGTRMLPGRRLWERASNKYNENVFVLCCRTTLLLLRRPHKHFEPLIAGHFNRRGRFLLEACAAYATGRLRVGQFGIDRASAGSAKDVSGKFKEGMVRLYPMMVEAFRKSGASLENCAEKLELEAGRRKKTAPFKFVKKKGRDILGKLKELVLGSKKRKKRAEEGVN